MVRLDIVSLLRINIVINKMLKKLKSCFCADKPKVPLEREEEFYVRRDPERPKRIVRSSG